MDPLATKLRLDVSLFGHHHAAAPTFLSRLSDATSTVAHLPLAVWLTVIPIAGGLAIAYVTHWLNLSRDRAAIRREEERRRANDDRATLRVRADLAFRLGRHREALRAAVRGGDIARLEAEHRALVQRASKTDVIDALGKRYLPFMAVLQREEAALLRLGLRDTPRSADSADHVSTLAAVEASLDEYLDLFALSDAAPPVKT